jgi:cysteinyl-tRNA synthetase
MDMRLYNTMTRKKEEFVPLMEGAVGMYVCGPTVYDYIHVGNARPLVVFDVLRRYLEHLGYKVMFVQNITDVDDKLINRAKREGTTVAALAEKFTAEYLADLGALGSKPATYSPKATEHIGEIITLIKALEDKGLAYAVENGDVYFDTQAFPKYGRLSGQDMEELEAGARVEVGEIKRHPMDFALWKATKPGEPAWESPWGMGRPGWHIECSAMSMKYLGETLDIHAGGQDLIFPHHENEIAQSEGATGRTFVRYWLHNGYINIDNQKMSKSLGNFFTVKDVLAKFEPEVLRLFMLSAHYRSPMNFSFELMQQAETALQRLYTARDNMLYLLGNDEKGDASGPDEVEILYIHEFKEAMDDDLNTADAIGALFSLVKYYNTRYIQSNADASRQELRGALKILLELSNILGLLGKKADNIPEEVKKLAEERRLARMNRDWALSDKLRDEIKEKGFLVEDTKEGQKVRAI